MSATTEEQRAGSLIGTSVRRSDGEAKVRGEARYTFDVELPRMLHARLLRSPIAAGRVVRLDVARTAEMPGVHAIATALDCETAAAGWFVKDQQLFAYEQIRYAGEPIAAVAAETWAQAQAAVAAIELEVEPVDPIRDVHAALADDARLIHPDWAGYALALDAPLRGGNVAWESLLERGDVAAAFARADVVVESTYETPRQPHTPIEPHCAVAEHRAGRFTIYSSSQYSFATRDRVAEFLGVRKSAVRVIVPPVGGAFGGKLDALLEPYACVLAQRTGRPVKIVNTRAEQLATAGARDNAVIRIRTAATAAGDLLAHDVDVLLDSGAYCGETGVLGSFANLLPGSVYRVEALRSRARVVYTNTFATSAFRGVCGLYMTFAMERQLDKLAARLGADRRELRLRNALRPGEAMANGQLLEDEGGFADAFAAAERAAPWADLAGERRPHRGVGIAAVTWLTNPEAGAATIKLNEDGTINLIAAAPEIGTGAVAAGLVQLAAEAVGVAPEDVVLAEPDTDVAAWEAGGQGSRTLFNTGRAVQQAGGEVREQILAVAAGLLEADPADLWIADGQVGIAGVPGRQLPLSTIALTAMHADGPIQGRGAFRSKTPAYDAGCVTGAVATTINCPSYHVHLAEVEVDPETGKVRIVRYVVVQDVGRAINPTMIEGQVHGAVAQGVGYATMEQLLFEDAVVVNADLEGYRLPTALDVPPIELHLLELPSAHGPFGAKGAGEPAIVPAPAAIANAICDAVGADFDRLPITPFDVLAALRGRSGAEHEKGAAC